MCVYIVSGMNTFQEVLNIIDRHLNEFLINMTHLYNKLYKLFIQENNKNPQGELGRATLDFKHGKHIMSLCQQIYS